MKRWREGRKGRILDASYPLCRSFLQVRTNFGLVLLVDDQARRRVVEHVAIALSHVLKVVGHACLARDQARVDEMVESLGALRGAHVCLREPSVFPIQIPFLSRLRLRPSCKQQQQLATVYRARCEVTQKSSKFWAPQPQMSDLTLIEEHFKQRKTLTLAAQVPRIIKGQTGEAQFGMNSKPLLGYAYLSCREHIEQSSDRSYLPCI